jgi:hypothetical protein
MNYDIIYYFSPTRRQDPEPKKLQIPAPAKLSAPCGSGSATLLSRLETIAVVRNYRDGEERTDGRF